MQRRHPTTFTISHCYTSECDGRDIALPIAQLRAVDGILYLYWRRGRSRWAPYLMAEDAPPFAGTLRLCLAEIDADRWGCFWN